MSKLRYKLHEQEGATAVEYGIMVALIAVVIITAVALLGGTLSDTFAEVECEVEGAGDDPNCDDAGDDL